MEGSVVHFELPFDDPVRARAFYADAFGWRLTELPAMNYTTAGTAASDDMGIGTEPGAINGGLAERGGPITTPVITIGVDDVDAALNRVTKYGGSVVQGRTAVGEMGFSAYFTDTEGSVVGLWQSAS